MKVSKKREQFLQQLAKGFNITTACQAAGIGRNTYYHWIKDPSFSRACDEIEESLIDHVESKLLEQINKGDSGMIKWFLEHKAEKRGWAVKQEIEHTGAIEIKFTKELVSKYAGD